MVRGYVAEAVAALARAVATEPAAALRSRHAGTQSDATKWRQTLPATRRPWRAALLIPARIRHGRPARLVLRVVAAAVLAVLVLHSGAGTPPVAGLLTGIGTWLLLTVRGDLAPPPGR